MKTLEGKIRCLIVEDEPIAQEIIKSYSEKSEILEVVGQFRNALEAFTFLQHTSVDLVFLDIRMPRMSGLEMLRALSYKPKTIIISAYRDFAIDAFELDVIDYLLKPISFDRFMKAVRKATTANGIHPAIQAPAKQSKNEKPFLFVKGNKQLQKVFLDEILYLESQRDYVRIKLLRQPDISTRQTITYFEQLLPAQSFLRVHRSFIVATARIARLEANKLYLNDEVIPVGRNFKQNIQDFLSAVQHPPA